MTRRKIVLEVVVWINLDQVRVQWLLLVNTVMNLWTYGSHKRRGVSWPAELPHPLRRNL